VVGQTKKRALMPFVEGGKHSLSNYYIRSKASLEENLMGVGFKFV
jgi:hypothetical protein